MTLELKVITGGGVPIYRQLVDQIRLAVATRQVKAGDPLPSVRTLAEMLIVNPNTVARAYGDLVRDGLAENRPGIGLFIAEPRQILSDAERHRRLSAAVDNFVSQVAMLGYEPASLVEEIERRLILQTETDHNDPVRD